MFDEPIYSLWMAVRYVAGTSLVFFMSAAWLAASGYWLVPVVFASFAVLGAIICVMLYKIIRAEEKSSRLSRSWWIM